ncbi:MAG TPA: hypothetical protein VFC61_10380, partial [Blastocatellia bacterium]|nr:hypothetical protein [Blastocatellia bacterium]
MDWGGRARPILSVASPAARAGPQALQRAACLGVLERGSLLVSALGVGAAAEPLKDARAGEVSFAGTGVEFRRRRELLEGFGQVAKPLLQAA